jgi:mono/diheme cytochrome c family protein
MRSQRWAVGIVSLAAVAGAVFVVSCARQGTQQAAAPAAIDTLARGQYLVTVMSCGDCHTPGTFYGAPDMARQLSGSELGWKGPWGVSYARNLTPDVETGIGAWSKEQIVNALRTGTRPDGSRILPPMPWPNYGGLKDEDALAIATYLKSLPPVTHKVPTVIPPGKPAKGSILVIPPPPPWDAPRTPPPGSPPGGAPAAGDSAAAKQ